MPGFALYHVPLFILLHSQPYFLLFSVDSSTMIKTAFASVFRIAPANEGVLFSSLDKNEYLMVHPYYSFVVSIWRKYYSLKKSMPYIDFRFLHHDRLKNSWASYLIVLCRTSVRCGGLVSPANSCKCVCLADEVIHVVVEAAFRRLQSFIPRARVDEFFFTMWLFTWFSREHMSINCGWF